MLKSVCFLSCLAGSRWSSPGGPVCSGEQQTGCLMPPGLSCRAAAQGREGWCSLRGYAEFCSVGFVHKF